MNKLMEGQPAYVKGSGTRPYELKNTGGVHSCSCPAWRNQSLPVERRTCKHLKAWCGEAQELARVGSPAAPPAPAPRAARVSPGCACELGRHCDVAHDPATCPCAQCTTAELAPSKREILERAASQGRKLRQDEKAKLNGPPVLLAQSFEDHPDLDPTGWWMSEKLDGVRAWWDGTNFISRQGNVFHAPDWFKASLPDHPLDGELWMGRKAFQKTISVVKRHDGSEQWRQVKYVVFDAPHLRETPFEERMRFLDSLGMRKFHAFLAVHSHKKVLSKAYLLQELRHFEGLGAEGLMIRRPGSLYEAGRSDSLLKVKPFKDAEATVTGHTPGKGRHKGVLGALEVRTDDGKEFSLGTGLSDAERRDPPKVGSRVTYRFTELTDGGIPKCASFVCSRDYE